MAKAEAKASAQEQALVLETAHLLTERIAAVFSDTVSSKTIAGLIAEVGQAVSVAEATYNQARGRALSPTTQATDVALARRDMDDARFIQERMREAAVQLEAQLSESLEREQAARTAAAYKAAITERNAVAVELNEYPALVTRLIEILVRLEASDRQMSAVGNCAPDRRTAEQIARPLSAHRRNANLLDQIILPDFDRDLPLLWPPRHLEASHRYFP